jgi:protoporphyrin/coproporphyrin ferrochelatase
VTTRGVALLAYGTPKSPDEVEAYYTHIRRGRPPAPDQLADLVRRYDAIGGISPLRERTEAQRAALQSALDRRTSGDRIRVELGFKHASPFIEDAVDTLIAGGVDDVTALVLAPQFSALSVGEYLERAAARAAEAGVSFRSVSSWHDEDAYLRFVTEATRASLAALPDRTKVVFTAHSLPARVLESGDPYPGQLRETAELVAERLGLDRWAGWTTAWQSAGRTPEPWLGPDVTDVVRELGATGRADGVCVCPCGFVADHLEVLYDLDIDARRVAGEAGLDFARTAVVNDDAGVMAALAERVLAA